MLLAFAYSINMGRLDAYGYSKYRTGAIAPWSPITHKPILLLMLTRFWNRTSKISEYRRSCIFLNTAMGILCKVVWQTKKTFSASGYLLDMKRVEILIHQELFYHQL